MQIFQEQHDYELIINYQCLRLSKNNWIGPEVMTADEGVVKKKTIHMKAV